MFVSSRTPEGRPNECPICQATVCIEPSLPFGEAPCPNCGCLLWFFLVGGDARFYPNFESAALRERVENVVAERLGVDQHSLRSNPNWISQLGADSLDMVELVMALEEEFD